MPPDLRRRLVVAAIGIPACVAVAAAGGLPFAVGLGALAAVGTWEVGRMLRERGDRIMVGLGASFAAALPLAALYLGPQGLWTMAAVGGALLVGVATFRFPPSERPFQTGAFTAFTAIYLGGLLSYGVPLREQLAAGRIGGTLVFFLPVTVTWLADTAAYFGGRSLGRRKLAPVLSPNKTVEGAVAELIAGPIVALLYGTWLLPDLAGSLGPVRLGLLGLLVSIAAIIGDLVESGLKRECGVKDSSGLLPGHGGLLDRMDSLLWSIPVAYLFLQAVQ